MTTEATPAAAPAAPAAAQPESQPAAPAAPAAKPTNAPALLDSAPPSDPNAPPPVIPGQEAPAKWYLSEGVPGKGEPPEWFKADKYKSADEQARAYVELEKRMGAFTGAPKDGAYQVNKPDGINIEFDTEHPVFGMLNEWAKEAQMSQKGYDGLIKLFAEYELSQQPSLDDLKKQIGDNADQRIGHVSQWAKSNLSADQIEALNVALTMRNAADVFKAFEAVVSKTRQAPMPKADDTVPGSKEGGLAEIQALHNKKNEKGQYLYQIDQKHREMVEKKYADYFAAQQPRQVA